jgi:hypothetical protein
MITRDELLTQKLLALSLKDPFGILMLYDKIETRTWPTNYRGLVMICCSKMGYSNNKLFNICGEKQFERVLGILSRLDSQKLNGNHKGNAIAVGRLIDCRPMQKKDEDSCFVQYFPDLFCHVYQDITPIVPLLWNGTQKWKEVDQSFKELIVIKS